MTSALLALPVDAQVRHEIKVPDYNKGITIFTMTMPFYLFYTPIL